jgi:hypothetical protein
MTKIHEHTGRQKTGAAVAFGTVNVYFARKLCYSANPFAQLVGRWHGTIEDLE